MSVLIVMAAIKKMQKPKRIVSLLNRIIIKIKRRFKKHNISRNVSKTRYMIEAKNSELKNIHGYSRCDAAGLSNMQLQGAVSIFAVNLKRILKLKGEVCPNEEE